MTSDEADQFRGSCRQARTADSAEWLRMHASLSAAEKLLRCHGAGIDIDLGRGRAVTLLQCRRGHMRRTEICEARQLTAWHRAPL